MAKEKLILDIRYYESDVENIAGNSLPSGPGRLFQYPKSIHYLGARIARKLREKGFITGSFDHVYINFTTALGDGEARFSPRETEPWLKYVDYGASPLRINNMSDAEKESFVASTTFDILRLAASGHSAQSVIIDDVQHHIELSGSEIEITHKTKDTKSYTVTVTYQIRPNGRRSLGFVEYVDKKTGNTSRGKFVELNDYEDIFALVGTISVSRGVICLKPRSSFKARLYTKKYEVPIEIPIAELNAA